MYVAYWLQKYHNDVNNCMALQFIECRLSDEKSQIHEESDNDEYPVDGKNPIHMYV